MTHRSLRRRGRVAMLVLVLLLAVGGAIVPTRPTGQALAAPMAAPDNSVVLQPFVSGFTTPVHITHAGDGSHRLFVVERGGLIKEVVNGQVRPTPFIDLSGKISLDGEEGLLGLAFHPSYETNKRFFVYYTAKRPVPDTDPINFGSTTLEEYAVSNDPEVALSAPVHTYLSIPDRANNHNGGTIAFGPDGYLYLGTGDEGGGGDPFENAQNLQSLYGKILRLDVDRAGTPDPPGAVYAIPPTNPFVGRNDARPEIWAFGLRNPYRWSFDRATGEMFIGDVGQGAWEEIDLLPAGVGGLNLGWDDREGAHCFEPPTNCLTSGRLDPILEYDRATNGPTCASVTGGYRYRGSQSPSLKGNYFYADFCSGKLWKGVFARSGDGRAGIWRAVHTLDTGQNVSSFGEDAAGELYVVTYGGAIFRLVESTPPLACSVRPNVTVQSSRAGAGAIDVVISVTDNSTVPNNQLQSIAFTQISNARVSVGTEVDRRSAFTVPFAGGTRTTRVTVKRDQAGQAFLVSFAVTDRCGPWPSFVGGGPGFP
jgi:glucose/arabinose dehydrogenase